MATSENRKDSKGEWTQETTWHNIVIWGPAAERAAESLKKGFMIYVEGKISIRPWEDKEGNKRTNYEIVCFTYRNLTSKEVKAAAAGQAGGQTNGGNTQPPMDEDLPF
jgi:single-strand DNA-binding protein